MNYKIVGDLDHLAYRLECGVDVLFTIEEALERGDYRAQDYADPVFGAYDHLTGLVKELKQVIDAVCTNGEAEV